MKNIRSLLAVWGILLLTAAPEILSCQTNQVVVISTDLGDIRLKLYNETPLHRDNFVKLVKEGYFDGMLFHRVIQNFMIQGGDPQSKNAAPGARLGNGGPGYTIPAEFVPGLFHRKGAIAAARMGDQVNPSKESSGSQFYIVQGKKWRQGELDTLEVRMNSALKQNIQRKLFMESQKELETYRQEKKEDLFNRKMMQVQITADSLYNLAPKMKLSEIQKKVYTSVGGYPSLDGAYTVFGEVTEGFDVIDRIAAEQTDKADRPLRDIKMKIKVVQ
jgi:cyclophilin family peptidyl-prolyl cis-trans isomerase